MNSYDTFLEVFGDILLLLGWKRELVYRKNQKKGSTADVYYIAPNGIRLRSLPEVDDYCKYLRFLAF